MPEISYKTIDGRTITVQFVKRGVWGYADAPGTGPAGETCGTCKHKARRVYSKTYHKCRLMQAIWTHGAATDIRVRSPACSKWEKQEEKPPCPK